MGKRINTVEELNSALGVKNLQELKGRQINDLIGLLSDINPDLLDKVISAIPVSAEALSLLIKEVSKMYDENYTKIVGGNETIKAYKDMLEIIKRESSKENLSFDELEKYIAKMKEIAIELSREERIKEDFDREIREQKTGLIISLVGAVLVTAIILFVCWIIPGIILDIAIAVLGIIAIIIILVIFNRKRKRIKIKYKVK